MIDETDRKIIDVLKHDASLSTHKITKKTNIPQTTVLNRIKKLKKDGIIKKYTVDLDYKKLDKSVKALIFVKVDTHTEKKSVGNVGKIESILFKHPCVLNIKRLMGNWDFVMEIVCRDIEELDEFLIKKVRSIDLAVETETIVVLNEWINS